VLSILVLHIVVVGRSEQKEKEPGKEAGHGSDDHFFFDHSLRQ